MPGKIMVLGIIGILLQYTLVILLYYFLYKVVKMIFIDLRQPVLKQAEIFQPFTAYRGESGKLSIIENGQTGIDKTAFQLGETFSIGRSEQNDVTINDGFTSHEHACITKIKDAYWLYDLGSTNGTYLNGKRIIKEESLRSGDLIRIGTVTFRFER